MTFNQLNIKIKILVSRFRRMSSISLLLASGFWLLTFSACNEKVVPSEIRNEKPDIFPDYTEVTIPENIAPLNFRVNDEYSAIDAVIEGRNKEVIHVQDKKYISIPAGKWAQMLTNSKGDSLRITVSIEQQGKWIQFAPFSVYVSEITVDYGLVYRLIAPGYEVYSKMGIYQRNLSNFDQSPIVENTLIPGSCVNCHSFRQSDPKQMSLHIRGKLGGTVLMTDGKLNLLNTKTEKTISNFVYPYWHPSGNYIAYSVNNTNQGFHATKEKRVEVVDGASDVVVYDIKNNRAISNELLMQDSIFETFPSFSPDGKTLYFCSSASRKMPEEYNQVRYNLCSISFNPEDGTFGDRIDTLFHATALNKSVTFPRPSPDGRFIMFTLIDYGNFSIWHKEADLYLFDVRTGNSRPMVEVNSDDTESYHSWATNSRWFVFSSRRIDGLYTRPYLAYLGENGIARKPFLLPQENPDFYLNLMESFNIPEFITGKVEIDPNDIEKIVLENKGKQVENLKLQ
jgi:Tol biopolymer transport system component